MNTFKSYKIRLYPNKTQEQELVKILGACRWIYNYFLERRKQYYQEHKRALSYSSMYQELKCLRQEMEWLHDVQSEPLEQSMRRLDSAYQRFFKKVSGFPRFKSKKDAKQSFQKHKDWKLRGNKIQIQRSLIVKYRGKIDDNAKLGTVIISKNLSGHWYASITATIQVKQSKRYTKPIGIDVGLETLATTSRGKKYPNIRSERQLVKLLRARHQTFSRKKKGSKRRDKARIELARTYERISNIRHNHLHQVSHDITSKNHALIAVEDLNVKGMMQNHCLARSFADASVSQLLRQIEYKQRWKGREFVKIGRFFPSSKTCSGCGFIIDLLPLNIRQWKCPQCKRSHDRDINAAKMILKASAYDVRGEGLRAGVKPRDNLSVKRGYAKA